MLPYPSWFDEWDGVIGVNRSQDVYVEWDEDADAFAVVVYVHLPEEPSYHDETVFSVKKMEMVE